MAQNVNITKLTQIEIGNEEAKVTKGNKSIREVKIFTEDNQGSAGKFSVIVQLELRNVTVKVTLMYH